MRLTPDGGAPFFVCNGAPGAVGPAGESAAVTPEPPGASCEFGGVKLQVGSGLQRSSSRRDPADGGDRARDGRPLRRGGGRRDRHRRRRRAGARARRRPRHPRGAHAPQRDLLLGTSAATFATLCDGLVAATTYFVRAFATNALGTSYGEERSFTTRALTVPAISTQPASNVTHSTAIAGGIIADDGGTPILGRGICWSPAPDPIGAVLDARGAGRVRTRAGRRSCTSLNLQRASCRKGRHRRETRVGLTRRARHLPARAPPPADRSSARSPPRRTAARARTPRRSRGACATSPASARPPPRA